MIITRFYKQEKINLTFEFLTPAYLGGADQNAEIRTAPFKNLLRQWWRVANDETNGSELARKENRLFGLAADDGSSHASSVRISVKSEQDVPLSNSKINLGSIKHAEVNIKCIEKDLYLGYGLKRRTYFPPGSRLDCELRFVSVDRDEIQMTLSLIHHFGTIGGRSRNGWGSLSLQDKDFMPKPIADLPKVDLSKAIDRTKYPHTLGADSKGLLLWETEPGDSYESLLGLLAEIYKEMRLKFPFSQGDSTKPDTRHFLGYPITHHNKVFGWDRMPSQIRLMVKQNEQNKLAGRILHVPHKLPYNWPKELPGELELWKKVHEFFDSYTDEQGNKLLRRIP